MNDVGGVSSGLCTWDSVLSLRTSERDVVQVQVRGRRSAGWWITFGIIAFGTLFFAVGAIVGGVSISFVMDAERAKGTVVYLEWEGGSQVSSSSKSRHSSGPTAHPVVEFKPAGGELTTFRSSMGSNPPAYDTGERVGVLYRADDLEDAKIDGFVSLWLIPLIFCGIGLLIAGIGTAIAIATRRRSRRTHSGSGTARP
ncbi:DUF3592 domain-containing protein [Streptomyces sp. NPDC056341]|uniref:DUF3592 domain-containing protein n=1 Tax=Streptomyces sp. NPDC056341 TaxID=3345788 RepID=UPI0035DBC35F